ncbi:MULTISPECIES: hypothetical protein [unclassified Leptolyngbya]|uniref:hypothetical protein n=1 Tax=unclassified Leptolyngbya TaxID=2650499 RepID=UPI001681E4D3|nr:MULTISPECIES: hypothetical protein [unclassified Leptolyngbya]MBD1911225.1 hypothetical protein [Leptolyngbya sp. FACHB-8]MBD2155472.1 hypothetical protein [Leptolyngbya sp. FACHB-16]
MTSQTDEFQTLVEAVFQAVVKVGETRDMADGLVIRDQIRRLPDALVTEILNQIILRLVLVNPELCRWFVLEVFLHDTEPEARADVAERINVLIADLQESSQSGR